MTLKKNQRLAITTLAVVCTIALLSTNLLTQALTGDYINTRQDENCLSQDGWYWTGQTCLRCSPTVCKTCTAATSTGSSSCQTSVTPPGYQLYTDATTNTNYWRYCGSNGIATCIFLPTQSNPTLVIQQNDFQAITCQSNYQLFGGYCVNEPNCATYTQYGRCQTCLTGYYLTQDGTCTQCSSTAWTYSLSPVAQTALGNTNGVCATCNGPNQCSTCGITWFTGSALQNSYGSYLATDIGRQYYDQNIAAYPSQCRACSPGCNCAGPTSLCDSCITSDNTWYMDPIQRRCFLCNATCIHDESTLKTSNPQAHRINCCNKCQWDTTLLRPRCLTCQTQFNGVAAGTDTYNGQVVSVADSYMPTSGSNYYLCYRCDRPQRSLSGFSTPYATAPQNYDFDYYSNFAYQMPSFSISTSTGSSGDFWTSYDYLNTSLPGDPFCTQCSLQQIKIPTVSSKGVNSTYNGAVSLNLNYLSCSSCQNSYELLTFITNSTVNYTFQAYDQVGNQYFWFINQKAECRSCQYLIWNQDGQPQSVPDTTAFSPSGSTQNQTNRYQYVRRCKNPNSPAPTSALTQFTITQCGSFADTQTQNSFKYTQTKYPDYLYQSNTADNQQRGPTFTENVYYQSSSYYLSQFTNAQRQTLSPSGVQQYFLVMTNNNQYSQMCLKNTYNCQYIQQPINLNLLSTNASQAIQCTQCYTDLIPVYVLTTGGHCMPWAANLVAPNNYFLDMSQNPPKCIQCASGCLTCQYSGNSTSTICTSCIMYFGKTNTGSTFNCQQCQVPYCISCDYNQTICLQCAPGFRLDSLNGQAYCEACDTGCMNCDSNRKVCNQCFQNTVATSNLQKYYLSNGVCRPPMTGCVDWQLSTGTCNWCAYGYTLVSGICYPCFGQDSGFIDCSSGGTNTQFQYMGTDVRRNGVSLTSRILSLLDEIDEAF